MSGLVDRLQPQRVVRGARERAFRRRWRLPRGTGAVALTFDDGPDPTFTPLVLDELKSLGVTATFFCVGERAVEAPAIIRRMRDEGHAVGSHGQRHDDLPTLSTRALVADLRTGHRHVEGLLGTPTALFRPPHGDLAPRTALTARSHGWSTWLWTVDPEDWRPRRTAGEIVAGCGRLADGDVVVLHDGLEQPEDDAARDRSATVHALRAIVESARADGLQFVGLPA